ncbi:MAG: MBL fold metallo-hydrolase [Rhodocyclaceae bacterium]|nr:MBL fold metallo-hydrolase [Rhodocyclaceae bacterium]
MTHFRQIHEARSHSYAYLLVDSDRREAVMIDPAAPQLTLYLALLDELQARLTHVLLTHSHDRHAAGAEELCRITGAQCVAGRGSGVAAIDLVADDDALIPFGDEVLRCRTTPGHTPGCVSYLWRDRAFTGDALLIGDCGAAAAGDAGLLFDSITRKLLTLADETLIYPAHDFAGRRVSCIGEQRDTNPKLAGTTRDEFIAKQAQCDAHDHARAAVSI